MSTTPQSPSFAFEPATSEVAGSSQPIGAYGLLADCNTAALADCHGSIDWLCLPRNDSPGLFARILAPRGGGVRLVHDELRGRRRLAADHVRGGGEHDLPERELARLA
jgi:Domain of unknown function (DUF5911)